jgi:2-polyprenyl-3-methyl-5-hydroxy-6-metoxy-1,4-benzoquinol methylase
MRFEFGKNWGQFLALLNEERIRNAEQSLQEMVPDLPFDGVSFLDIGSGSGLFSLAARRLGARVASLDVDPLSVACTRELKNRFYSDDNQWKVLQGSVLDQEFLRSLGRFSLVYSWGVLHHTGSMWQALENILIPLTPKGLLYIAIYNDQGWASQAWKMVKKTYNRSPLPLKQIILGVSFLRLWGPTLVRESLSAKPFHSWRNYDHLRGMSPWHDLVDWVGGYPFEVAAPEAITAFYQERGFRLQRIKSCGRGRGCNEFLLAG